MTFKVTPLKHRCPPSTDGGRAALESACIAQKCEPAPCEDDSRWLRRCAQRRAASELRELELMGYSSSSYRGPAIPKEVRFSRMEELRCELDRLDRADNLAFQDDMFEYRVRRQQDYWRGHVFRP